MYFCQNFIFLFFYSVISCVFQGFAPNTPPSGQPYDPFLYSEQIPAVPLPAQQHPANYQPVSFSSSSPYEGHCDDRQPSMLLAASESFPQELQTPETVGCSAKKGRGRGRERGAGKARGSATGGATKNEEPYTRKKPRKPRGKKEEYGVVGKSVTGEDETSRSTDYAWPYPSSGGGCIVSAVNQFSGSGRGYISPTGAPHPFVQSFERENTPFVPSSSATHTSVSSVDSVFGPVASHESAVTSGKYDPIPSTMLTEGTPGTSGDTRSVSRQSGVRTSTTPGFALSSPSVSVASGPSFRMPGGSTRGSEPPMTPPFSSPSSSKSTTYVASRSGQSACVQLPPVPGMLWSVGDQPLVQGKGATLCLNLPFVEGQQWIIAGGEEGACSPSGARFSLDLNHNWYVTTEAGGSERGGFRYSKSLLAGDFWCVSLR